MSQVTSRDGTTIAYSRIGSGPALILIDGAMCYRASGPMAPIASLLAPHFTVVTYDRRGRGESGNSLPYATDREVEDIEALVAAAGGEAFLFGISSGGALVLDAANRLSGIKGIAIYEAPFVLDDKETPLPADFRQRLEAAVADGRPGDAVALFMRRVRVPLPVIWIMRLTRIWKTLSAIAHTLPYDIALLAPHSSGKPLPGDAWPRVTMPALVMAGGKSPPWMQNAQRQVAGVLPASRHETLAGQTHMVKAEVIAPHLRDFFALLAAGKAQVPVA